MTHFNSPADNREYKFIWAADNGWWWTITEDGLGALFMTTAQKVFVWENF